MANLAGGVTSIALIAGVAVWGYQLVVRDVTGIPVVRATQGEMRIRPEEPGGQLAQNTGLAVNEVAGAGEASGPVDSLTLAPRPVDLSEEDQPMITDPVAPVQQPAPLDVVASLEAEPINVALALQNGEVDEIVRQLTQGTTPIGTTEVAEDEIKPVLVSVAAAPKPEEIAAVVTGPGPTQSHRPQLRPRSAPAVVVPASAPVKETVKDIDATSIPTGTRLVQLGAFDTPEIARAEWDKMEQRFGDYLEGKDRIIQTAESGGRTFYRLRAHGFTDLSDARRFCSALVTEGADCIPVVTR
ncbi:SPOR domain-containing protein [Tateyamaria sp.]|uniref:SPOR domain-containing protein n=1 Tax=Tateyamaria sp. TaxID=1929288 RepID=UPI00329A8243